ncbi:hypothetical protein [Streptomyces niger]|uniref:hypothetical protein n=1 Tax=Streptomyces niger TaxID=66373 RepID=UPI0018FEB0FC|nr:hypothetical protein [Streptomyces niger]
MVDEVALCLQGFANDLPITVNVTVGGQDHAVEVTPVPGTLPVSEGPEENAPPGTLFDGAALNVYGVGEESVQSRIWHFVPPDSVRERLAAAGALRITAFQGGAAASRVQTVTLPREPERNWLQVKGSPRHLVVYGFGRGERVPVGLYAVDQSLDAVLVRQIGTVVMPASRVVVFTVPHDVLALRPKTKYCVTVPLSTQGAGCSLG